MSRRNSHKIILDLCGGTGAWSEPYRKAGYDVKIITLPDYDVTEFETFTYLTLQRAGKKGITFKGKNGAPDSEVELSKVHGILAAPPCTMFSLARQRAKTPRDFQQGMVAVAACMSIIWNCRASGSLRWWSMENPVGYLRQFMGKPALTFQPWWYGDNHSKRTDLWGYFHQPRRTTFTPPKKLIHNSSLQRPVLPGAYKQFKFAEDYRAAVRAITPAHFSKSFFKANP